MTSRIQLALNVADVEAATAFYSKLFNVQPHKSREGYANFVVEDPPLKLVLMQQTGAREALNHLGIELLDSAAVAATAARLDQRGLSPRLVKSQECCHAVQDKVYVPAPEVPLGFWEFYTVTDDAPTGSTAGSPCCPTSTAPPTVSGSGHPQSCC